MLTIEVATYLKNITSGINHAVDFCMQWQGNTSQAEDRMNSIQNQQIIEATSLCFLKKKKKKKLTRKKGPWVYTPQHTSESPIDYTKRL